MHEPGLRSGSRLDHHVDRYAARAAGMTASEIRALFAVASRPEVVSLAGGMPYTAALPLDSVGAMVNDLLVTDGAAALQYGSAQGEPLLREQICDVMHLEGISAGADDVVVTVGSQQALDLVTKVFCDPGDVVLAEAPSYVGALGTFAAYQCEVRHIAMDADGLVPSALRETLSTLRDEGRRAKFLYTIPNFHNPAGVSLSVTRRAEILDICQAAGVLVLEDNPYGLLGFDGDPGAAIRSMDDYGVVYLGSFSKTIAPGLRVGWVLAPPGVRSKIVLASEAAILCPPQLNQMVVARYLSTQPWLEQIKVYRSLYRERRDAMVESLAALMPQCRWNVPQGGFYVWAQLPDGVDAKEMLPRAVSGRVAYVPGSAFFADASGSRHVRLSYCYPEPDRIREGVRRLAAVLAAEMDLIDTFGTGASRGLGEGRPGMLSPQPDIA